MRCYLAAAHFCHLLLFSDHCSHLPLYHCCLLPTAASCPLQPSATLPLLSAAHCCLLSTAAICLLHSIHCSLLLTALQPLLAATSCPLIFYLLPPALSALLALQPLPSSACSATSAFCFQVDQMLMWQTMVGQSLSPARSRAVRAAVVCAALCKRPGAVTGRGHYAGVAPGSHSSHAVLWSQPERRC